MSKLIERARDAARYWEKNSASGKATLVLDLVNEIDRLSAQQREPVVRVKELRWYPVDNRPATRAEALSAIGLYIVADLSGDGRFAVGLDNGACAAFLLDEAGDKQLRYATIDEAKSAAQADYEQRIMAAIEIQSSDGGVEGHAAVSCENRSTLESAREGSAAIAPSVSTSPHREDAAGIKPGPSEAIADVSVDELALVLDRLVNAPALKGVRELVAGWNGENRPEGLYKDRHPNRLGATLPRTNCGAVYELDEAMQSARAILDRLASSGRR